jgi:hypothetical protein
MAALARGEIISTKRALSIVTRHATLRSSGGMMVQRLGLSDLSPLRHSGPYLMAFVARQFLVLAMTETDTECLGRLRRARVTTQLMTGAAGRDVASAGLRARGMASVTSIVRAEAGGYRKRHATADGPVTGRAAHASHVDMTRVVKLHPKASHSRESLQHPAFRISVTNRANRTVGT